MGERDRHFFRHFWTYVAINAIFFLINELSGTSTPWFLWVMVIWGVVIVVHAVLVGRDGR